MFQDDTTNTTNATTLRYVSLHDAMIALDIAICRVRGAGSALRAIGASSRADDGKDVDAQAVLCITDRLTEHGHELENVLAHIHDALRIANRNSNIAGHGVCDAPAMQNPQPMTESARLEQVGKMVAAAMPVLAEFRFVFPGLEKSEERREFWRRAFGAVVPMYASLGIADAWRLYQQLDECLYGEDDSIVAEVVMALWYGLADFVGTAEPFTADDIEARMAYVVEFEKQNQMEDHLLPRVAADLRLLRTGSLPAPGAMRLGEWHAAREAQPAAA